MADVMLIWDSSLSPPGPRPATPADFGGSGTGGSAAADGASAPTTTQQVGGKDGSGNLQTLLTNTSGSLVPATAGAGAVDATTQRVTHASDDPVTTALQIIDDWDESDRAKANIIVGQAGVTGGAGAVAANTPRVTLASDDPLVALAGAPTTGTKSNVDDTNASTTILAANASRKGATFWNDSTAVLYLDLSGGTASATSCSVKIPADGYFELPDNGKRGVYTGLITGIWASDASGAVRVTEFT